MREVKAVKINAADFAPYGTFCNMTEPEGYPLSGEIHKFYPDRISGTCVGSMAFSPIAVRKDEIVIMKYIGATDSFVRAPFMLEGIVLGIIGAAIPLIGLYFGYNAAISYILNKFNVLTGVVDFIPVLEMYRTLLPISLGLGIGIGLIGSFFTTRKHLRV